MEAKCPTCSQSQRKFFCTDCIRTHLRDFRAATTRASQERDEELNKVSRSLTLIQSSRLQRADKAKLEDSISEVNHELELLRDGNVKLRERVSTLRQSLSQRKANLAQAQNHLNHIQTSTSQIKSTQQQLQQTQLSLSQTRRVLIKSLVEAFDLREATQQPVGHESNHNVLMNFPFAARNSIIGGAFFGGRSSAASGGHTGVAPVKGEWSISGLVLPVPGDLRRYKDDHITAAITHTLHFLRLLTFYLGVKLPFQVVWSGKTPGVGVPSVFAIRGPEEGGWAEWTTPYPLYLTDPSSTDQTALPTTESFTTGLCMLNYNIAYLAHTQGVDIPLSVTGETLRNLWLICSKATDLFAKMSHATPTPPSYVLPLPTISPTFTLDFAQLLQTAGPAKAWSTKRKSKGKKSGSTGAGTGEPVDEWDLVGIAEGNEGVG